MLEALQHARGTAQSGSRKLQHLDPQAAAEIEALAAQIIPSDDSPGAMEAGVVYFIEGALATFDQEPARDLPRRSYRRAPHRFMGLLASPACGGNRDRAGWKPIAFEDAGAFQGLSDIYDTPGKME